MDPVPLAVIVLIITSVIIAAVVLSGGKKSSEKTTSPDVARTAVETEEPIAKTQPAGKESTSATKNVDTRFPEKLVQENGETTSSVDRVRAETLQRGENDKKEVVSVATEEPVLEESKEQEQATAVAEVASEQAYTHVATTEENGSEGISSEAVDTMVDNDMEEEEAQNDADEEGNQPEEQDQNQDQSNQDDQDDEQVENAQAEVEEPEEEVAEYDESEYHPEDVNQDFYYDEDQEERPSLTLDMSHSGDAASSANTPMSKSSRTLSTDASGDISGGLSPMKNSSAYKFGSHYQHKKVGASWVKDGNSQGSFSAASPVTVSPMRHSQPRKVIPVSDQDKPLSTKQSTKISQCKFTLFFVNLTALYLQWCGPMIQKFNPHLSFIIFLHFYPIALFIALTQTRRVCRRRRTR